MSAATRQRRRAHEDRYATWTGATRPYDLVKEAVVAIGAMALLATLLTIVFSSPDERPSTVAQWARTQPVDFVATASAELGGTSDTAGYGPPYNHAATGQVIGPIQLQKWAGVSHPIDTARDFVIDPLQTITNDPALNAALAAYEAASPKQQAAWNAAYAHAVERATAHGTTVTVPDAGAAGPVAPMMASLLSLAQSGGLDGALLTSRNFYQTDYTKPLLFMADGSLLSDRAEAQHLLGDQWGMMNETGSYPGQVWLWLYTFWYQIEPFRSSENADALVWALMALLSLAFICIPFIPGVRDIPRRIPLYRLIWREHYRGGA
ncbi:MAG TPA: hypothetical protein VN635_14120 [Conexibacter sp.]|nr:hypothetical protein [Conexibacter sp.]